ncbi:MAG: diguanylate cyclase, partial [Sandaracinaceae bacterium]|nr:diguanylate cyclase [Sandaracinaceae bacterium]
MRAAYGLLVAILFAGIPMAGLFRPTPEGWKWHHVLLSLLWCLWLLIRWLERRRQMNPRLPRYPASNTKIIDLEIALLLFVASEMLTQALGGPRGWGEFIPFGVAAFIPAFFPPSISAIAVMVGALYDFALTQSVPPFLSTADGLVRSGFIMAFGLFHFSFTRIEIQKIREERRKALEEERSRLEADIRLFRLAGAPGSSNEIQSEEKAARSSVEEIRDALFHLLDLLKRSLDLHTCILLFGADDGKLHIVEVATDSDEIDEGPFDAGAGAVGAVATRGIVMNLENLKPGYRGLCYYRQGASRVRCFLGVPVYDEGELRGALCADRLDERPFSLKEEEILRAASLQVLRILRSERIFIQLERSKREHAQLFEASRALGAALTEEQVLDTAIEAASALARFDFAAITSFDRERKEHRVLIARGPHSEQLQGAVFKDNHSLVAMSLKNLHYLPYRGEFEAKQVLFSPQLDRFERFRSALVLPLVVRDDPIGTLVILAERPRAFGEGTRGALQTLANQLAVALSNARAVKRLEEMATTDGLTGCLNKRAFLEELEAKMRSAQRFNKKLSLIVTDIDHFKSINDTYGHAVGDLVIKGLGNILKRVKRETDRVARFGGEEFCILCEETDTDGALRLAERFREELSKTL